MPGVPGAASTRRRLRAATFCGHGDCPSSDQFQYGNVKDKVLAEEEDRFIVCMTHQLGYGRWEELKYEVRRSWNFRFDWFIKSRTPKELENRFKQLVCILASVCFLSLCCFSLRFVSFPLRFISPSLCVGMTRLECLWRVCVPE